MGEVRNYDSPLVIALQENLSVREVMKFNFPNVQRVLDALVGSLSTSAAEGNLFLQDQNCEPIRKVRWKYVSPSTSSCQQIHQEPVHVCSDSVLCVGTHAMSDATSKFIARLKDSRRYGVTTTSKGTNSKLFDCEFNVNSGATLMQVL